jgi:hypothetical protein
VDATSVAGTTNVDIFGNQGFNGSLGGAIQGSLNASLPLGNNDVAAVAFDNNGQTLAAKIIPNQAVLGPVNGSNTIILGPGDETSIQSFTVNNLPTGLILPLFIKVGYHTAHGTVFPLGNGTSNIAASQYSALPATAVQPGDSHVYEGVAQFSQPGVSQSFVGVIQTTSKGGGAATVTLPAAWLSSKPINMGIATVFTFDYRDFPICQ